MEAASVKVSRRSVLVATAASPVLFGALSACRQDDSPDALETLIARARGDSALAAAVAAEHSSLSGAMTLIAADRRQHADALRTEVLRARPRREKAVDALTGPVPAVPGTARAAAQAVSTALRSAQDEATALVTGSLPRYRAGLIGSIAACCAGLREVLR